MNDLLNMLNEEGAKDTKYKRLKKGGETKLTQYKRLLNQKTNKQKDTQLKMKFYYLLMIYIKRKKIKKPLFNKLWNITIGAARMPTLQATILSLEELKKGELQKGENSSCKKKEFNAKRKES